MPRKAAGETGGTKEKPKLAVVRSGATGALKRAEEFEREITEELLERSGSEKLGPIVRAVIKLAALQFVSASELFEGGLAEGDRQLMASGSTMAGSARMNLISAHNLALGQAKAVREEADEEGMGGFYAPTAKAR